MFEISESPVALIIFLSTLAISLYTLFLNQRLMHSWVLHPFSLVRENRFHTMITSGFLHGDMMHLLFNMMTFYFFAFVLESIIGSAQFFILYFSGLILSDVRTVYSQKDNPNYRSLGASGAISAVLFAYVLYMPTTKLYMFLIPFGIPAPIFGVLYLLYCYYAEKKAQDNINHSAHLDGAIAGIVVSIVMNPNLPIHFYTHLKLLF